MGCDKADNYAMQLSRVSIHAPTWGATPKWIGCTERRKVSIHAPTWGATSIMPHQICERQFQSTHPHGVRLCLGTRRNALRLFQSTHPHGVRPSTGWLGDYENMFQSTHPHGVRLLIQMAQTDSRGFNPRTHMGCDRSI